VKLDPGNEEMQEAFWYCISLPQFANDLILRSHIDLYRYHWSCSMDISALISRCIATANWFLLCCTSTSIPMNKAYIFSKKSNYVSLAKFSD
jgi:hypothetical protein